MKILLMRHGETIWNQEGRLQGQCDIPLGENGIKQIRRIGNYLASTGESIDLILSSPLQRACKSAEIIAEAIGYPKKQIAACDLFLERAFGECEGLIYEEALTKYPDGNYPGMETLDELYARAAKAIRYCEEQFPDTTLLITSHGAFIKAVLVVLTHGRIEYFAQNVWINNGDYCILERAGEDWKISICNERDGYLPQMV